MFVPCSCCVSWCPFMFSDHILRNRELVALLYCVMTVYVLCLFLTVPWVGLQSMIFCDCGIYCSHSLTFCYWGSSVFANESTGLLSCQPRVTVT